MSASRHSHACTRGQHSSAHGSPVWPPPPPPLPCLRRRRGPQHLHPAQRGVRGAVGPRRARQVGLGAAEGLEAFSNCINKCTTLHSVMHTLHLARLCCPRFDARLEEGLKDAEDDYTGKPLSKWMPSLRPNRAKNTDPNESRAVFVGGWGGPLRARQPQAHATARDGGHMPEGGGPCRALSRLPARLAAPQTSSPASAASSACGRRPPRSAWSLSTAGHASLRSGAWPEGARARG